MVNSTLMSAANIGFAAKFIPLLDLRAFEVVKLWRDQTNASKLRRNVIQNRMVFPIEKLAPVVGRLLTAAHDPWVSMKNPPRFLGRAVSQILRIQMLDTIS
jgi:hypothetical protein